VQESSFPDQHLNKRLECRKSTLRASQVANSFAEAMPTT